MELRCAFCGKIVNIEPPNEIIEDVEAAEIEGGALNYHYVCDECELEDGDDDDEMDEEFLNELSAEEPW
jgi:hypothetical protein